MAESSVSAESDGSQKVSSTGTGDVVAPSKGIGNTSVVIGGLVICLCLALSEFNATSWMYGIWMTNPDNSHGLLVPFFSAYLLWSRRHMLSPRDGSSSPLAFWMGVALIVAAAALKCTGIYCRMMTLEAASVVPCLGGIALCCGGWTAAKWAWPSILFLVFMIPLPRFLGTQLSGTLQHISTAGSTYMLQLLGIPAVGEGNLIFLSHHSLGVAEACSGIRMLMSFFALTCALCFLVERPIWEKLLIGLTAPLIAVAANLLRITATGIAYEYGNVKLAEMIFHDLAGWLMMPVGLLLLGAELFFIARILPPVEQSDIGSTLQVVRN